LYEKVNKNDIQAMIDLKLHYNIIADNEKLDLIHKKLLSLNQIDAMKEEVSNLTIGINEHSTCKQKKESLKKAETLIAKMIKLEMLLEEKKYNIFSYLQQYEQDLKISCGT
jgi:predicted NUDIX family phosphoesterase